MSATLRERLVELVAGLDVIPIRSELDDAVIAAARMALDEAARKCERRAADSGAWCAAGIRAIRDSLDAG